MEQEFKGNDRRKTNVEHICTKEETIDAVADDVAHVKSEIVKIQSINERTIESLDRLETKLSSIDKKLFIDNGSLSIQTQLRDGASRMGQIEANIRTINAQADLNNKNLSDKIEDVKSEPRKYAIYTVGLISLLGALCGLILWISTNTGHINTNTGIINRMQGEHQPNGAMTSLTISSINN